MLDLSTETNVDLLRTAALSLDRENARLMMELHRLRQENRRLRGVPEPPVQQELAALQELLQQQNRTLYGTSSEKLSSRSKAAKKKAKQKPQKGHGPKAQPQLPVEPVIHDLDEADKICPQCGGALKEMAEQFEESDEITVIQRQFKILRHKRKKYRCNCQACIETAEGPTKLIAGGRYSPEFAVESVIDKYEDHLPLQRQARRMKQQGLDIEAQTLWDQHYALAKALEPTRAAIESAIRESDVVYADETSWRMLKDGGSRWQLWAMANDSLVSYRADKSRGKEAAQNLLQDFSGILMTDGYDVYASLAKEVAQFTIDGKGGQQVTHVNCWAHVRRKFFNVQNNFPVECHVILNMIKALYRLESKADGMAEDEMKWRGIIRNRSSRSVLARIHAWAKSLKVLPESGLGKATKYMLDHWAGLTAFVKDPLIPLDNNHVERAIRGPVLGRKNHLGSKSKRGAETSALFYTLIESAKLSGVDPKSYLNYAAKNALLNPGTVTLPSDLT